MSRIHPRSSLFTLGLLLSALPTAAAPVDSQIPLNYNFRGMARPGEALPFAYARNADSSTNNYRSSNNDRGFYFDTGDPNSIGGTPLIGATGITYSLFNSLGYANSTWPGASTNGFDCVLLGNRVLNGGFDLVTNANGTAGPPPAWTGSAVISSVSASGIVVTATTTAAHTFSVGEAVQVQGVIPASYNGNYIITAASTNSFSYVSPTTASGSAQMFADNVPVSAISGTAGTVTVTTTGRHGFGAGQTVAISGVNPAGYTGNVTVASVVSGTKFTYANATTGAGSGRMYLNSTTNTNLQVTVINTVTGNLARVQATTASAHNQNPGDTITLSGISVLAYDGTFTVATVPTTTTLTIDITPIGTMTAANNIGLNSVSGDGTTVQVTAANPHFLNTGDSVTMANITPSGYNGSASITVPTFTSNITSTTTTATVTTPSNHGFSTGQRILVTGASVINHNGEFNIASTPTDTTFTYTITSASGTSTGATVKNLNLFAYANATTGPSRGAFMAAATLDRSRADQITDLGTTGPTLDGNSQLGLLYMCNNGPNQFDVKLTFSDATSMTARLQANDWFGPQSDPAILAAQPVISQKRMTHPAGARIVSITGDGATATAVCDSLHEFAATENVTISGDTNSNFNGSFTVASAEAPKAVTNVIGDGTTTTATCTAHGYSMGDVVVMFGFGSNYANQQNGTYTLTAVTANTFSFASTQSSATATGFVVRPRFTFGSAVVGSAAGSNIVAINNTKTARVVYRGVQNGDSAQLPPCSTNNTGPALNLTEAVIALPSKPGVQLQSIAFTRNASWANSTTITSLGGDGATAYATVASTTGFIVGTPIVISGATPSTFNGTYTIASIPSTTQFTYANTTSGVASGTITMLRPGFNRGFTIYAATARTGIDPTAPNRDCSSSTVVTTTANVANVATDNFGTDASSNVVTSDDTSAVWFQYTATANVPILVSTCTSNIDTTIAVYDACGGSLIAMNDDFPGCGTGGSTVQFTATASQTYFIRVAGKKGAKGTFTLHLEDFPTPANGSCATAIAANAGLGAAGDNAGTTVHALDGNTSTCGGGNDGSGVWYTYTASTNGLVEARTCLDANTSTSATQTTGVTGVRTVSGTDSTVVLPLDTTLEVYSGTCGSLTSVACNDDGCSVSSRVQWTAAMGQTYYIRVAGRNNAQGTFVLHIDDLAHVNLPLPLQFSWNGICHGTTTSGPFISEQTVPTIAIPTIGIQHENRADANGFRGISDRGLLFDPNVAAKNALNYGGTIGYQGIEYTLYDSALQSDMVFLGNRTGTWPWSTGPNAMWPANGGTSTALAGISPAWLDQDDHTIPQESDVSGLNATFGPNTKIGILYHISNVGGTTINPNPATFDVTLTFQDGATTTVRVRGTDWFGGASAGPYNQLLPDASSNLPAGLEVQRILGIYRAVQNTDKGDDAPTGPLKVDEAVISTASLARNPGPNFDATTHGILTKISFSNPLSGQIPQTATGSGMGIYAATIRNPATYNLNYGPKGAGLFLPNMVALGGNGTFTVTVSRGSGSPNNITDVTINGSSIGLANPLILNDSGTSGDALANDNKWSRAVSIPFSTPSGPVSLPFTVTDAQSRSFNGNVLFTVIGPATATTPPAAIMGSEVLSTVSMSTNGSPTPNVAGVTINGAPLGLGTLTLHDDGTNGDATAGNGVYSVRYRLPLSNAGTNTAFVLQYTATATDASIHQGNVNVVVIPPVAAITPNQVGQGGTARYTVAMSNATLINRVLADETDIGLDTADLNDLGTSGDVSSNDGTWSHDFTVPNNAGLGVHVLPYTVTDSLGGTRTSSVSMTVVPRLLPISLLGFNRDVVVENTAVTPYADDATAFDTTNTRAFYQRNLSGSAANTGLPLTGAFTSTVDGQTITEAQLAPYTANNVLFMGNATARTLTFAPSDQRPYTWLAIFATSASATTTSQGTFTITFTDGSVSSQLIYNAFDWFNATPRPLTNLGHVNVVTDALTSDGINPNVYQTTINMVNAGLHHKSIRSITFTKPLNAGQTAVFAISGAANTTGVAVCCLPNGNCTLSTAFGCDTGVYHPEWLDCSTANCPIPPTDCDTNGTPDFNELVDCNTNETLDFCEASLGTAVDCDTDNTPDVCELVIDCNTNGTLDHCDAVGHDCDTNATPDICQGMDCNTNSTLDTCEVAVQDCDTNGTIDACDLASGRFDAGVSAVADSPYVLNGTAVLVPTPDYAIRLTEATTSVTGTLVFQHPTSSTVSQFIADFDFRMGGGVAPGADGIGFAMLNSTTFNTGVLFAETGPASGAGRLVVRLDTYDAGGEVSFNYIGLMFNGVQFASFDLTPHFSLKNNQWHHANVSLSGGAVTVVLTPNGGSPLTVFNSVAIPGFVPYSALFGLGARCGAVTNQHWVDNVHITLGNSQVADCNTNNSLDVCDAVGNDANTDSVPDVCQDCNTNSLVDSLEPGYHDCNNNATADFCEIASGSAADCNTDGTLDSCQMVDCNSNGILDTCDQLNPSLDCNTDGSIDACQLGDCNSNNTLDVCDVFNGASDCNSDQVPDVCQSADCNTDSQPDVCQLPGSDCNTDNTLDVCQLVGFAPTGYTATDVPKDIFDNADVDSVLTISAANANVTDVDVRLDIQHTWDGDVRVRLLHNSVTCTLASFRGGSGDNYTGTVFDDAAATAISSGTAPFAGTFRPENLLSLFNGQNQNGTWTLNVRDNVSTDTGTLLAWSLTITAPFNNDSNSNGTPDECDPQCPFCTGDINGDNRVDGLDVAGWVRCNIGGSLPADYCDCTAGMTASQFINKLLTDANPACP